jgi:hypothetical protein
MQKKPIGPGDLVVATIPIRTCGGFPPHIITIIPFQPMLVIGSSADSAVVLYQRNSYIVPRKHIKKLREKRERAPVQQD